MQELTQKNGRNWRRFTLQEDGVQIEDLQAGDTTSRKFYYNQLGPLKEDFKYSNAVERRFSPQQRRLILICSFLLAIVCFGVSGALAGPSNKTTPATVTFIAIGWVFLLTGSLTLFLTSKRVRVRTLFFSDDTILRLYARNAQDEDQIKSFCESYEKNRLAFWKREFEKEVEKNPEGLQKLLEYLNEKEQFTDKEYRAHLKKVTKANGEAKE